MDEFLWLQRLDQYRDDYEGDAFQQQVAGNWFSAQNAIKLYDQYVRLDEDGDGMLSQAELLAYHGSARGSGGGGGVQLTPAVIARIFQENITYQPAKMDYKTFLDLALALECRDHMQSLRYFWRVIDLRKDGLLHPSTVDFFFRDIRLVLLLLYSAVSVTPGGITAILCVITVLFRRCCWRGDTTRVRRLRMCAQRSWTCWARRRRAASGA